MSRHRRRRGPSARSVLVVADLLALSAITSGSKVAFLVALLLIAATVLHHTHHAPRHRR